jgi:hypothetical protein
MDAHALKAELNPSRTKPKKSPLFSDCYRSRRYRINDSRLVDFAQVIHCDPQDRENGPLQFAKCETPADLFRWPQGSSDEPADFDSESRRANLVVTD